MKLIDSIKESFFQYPTLYYSKDFNDVKHAVCHQMFIVLGNGYDWAHTKDPKKAGYLIEPSSRKVHGEWVRNFDKPYGKVVIDLDIDLYLNADKIYELAKIDHEQTKKDIESYKKMFMEIKKEITPEIEKLFTKRVRAKRYSEGNRPSNVIYIEQTFDKLPPKTLLPGDNYNESYDYFLEEIRENKLRDSPYPNFSKQYSCFWEEGAQYIQDDWKQEAINHLSYHVDYFNDEKRIKTYSQNPFGKEGKGFNDVLNIMRRQVKDGQKKDYVLKNYGFSDFDLNDDEAFKEAVKQRWEKNLQKAKNFLYETIEKLNK